jgi:hypothetical protein
LKKKKTPITKTGKNESTKQEYVSSFFVEREGLHPERTRSV